MSLRRLCSVRNLCALVLLFGLIGFSTRRDVIAQGGGAPGTVSWNATYPKAIDSVPPNPMGAVEVQGTYTTNPGFVAVGASFKYTPLTGGVPTGVALNMQNGHIGKLQGGIIVPWSQALPKGAYQGWLAVSYGPGNPPTEAISTVSQFTIK